MKRGTGQWTGGEVIMLACGVIMMLCAVGLILIAFVRR